MNNQHKKYRIGIDARFYGSRCKGLGRYTQRLIENLEIIDNFNEYTIFLRKENWNDYNPVKANFKKILADYRWYTFAEQIFMPMTIKKHKLDLAHFTHFNVPIFYQGKFIVTIHDLILKNFPTNKATTLNPLFYWIKERAYNFVINRAIKKSEKIIAVSDFTKNDIKSSFGVLADKINVIYEGASTMLVKDGFEDDIFLKLKLKKPYLLYVGNAYPHKNLNKLIEAFKLVLNKRSDLRLVLVGGMDYFYKRLINFLKINYKDLGEKVIFTDDLKDEDLVQIYKNAELYIFPSLYEGFGLPPLEAMYFGIPVVSSDFTCLPEILGGAAVYFNPEDAKDMAGKINEVLENSDLRAKLIKSGFLLIEKFSWEKMAMETKNIYLGILNKK